MTQYADEVDRANNIAQAITDEAVELVRRAAAPEQDPNNLDPYCCDCGEEIEEGRLKLLKKRCFGCQTKYERKQQLYVGR